MSEGNERLVILASSDEGALDILDRQADVLALTLPAMACLDVIRPDYITIDHFISRSDAYKDTQNFEKAFRGWIHECDRSVEAVLGIDRVFSSEAFWLLIRLSGLRYIVNVVDKINSRYKKIEFIVSSNINPLPAPDLSWKSLRLVKFGYGLESVMSFLYSGLNNSSCIFFKGKDTKKINKHLLDRLKSLLLRSPEIIIRRGKILFSGLLSLITRKDNNIWVVQGGYDVDVLKRACPNINFQYIREKEENYALGSEANDISRLRKTIIDLTIPFLHEWMPQYEKWVMEWVISYVANIVATYPSVLNGIDDRLNEDKPIAVLYSIGAEDALEEAIAKMCIKNDIPVFYFKHSGADNLFVEPSVFDRYMEKNTYIKRTQFLSSEIELKEYENIQEISCYVTGALNRPKMIKGPGSRKILYSVGPPTHHTYKEMGRIPSDRERFGFAKSLIRLTEKYQLEIDIKIHPAESHIGYEFIKNLLSQQICNSARILPEGTIERIIKNYGLIVLDMISTRVLTGVLNLDIPAILYVPENFPVNIETFSELQGRVYVVNGADQLDDLLNEYSASGLPGLYSESFSIKYLGTSDADKSLSMVKSIIFS